MAKESVQNRRVRRRDQITEVATKLFADKGYHRATLEEVARQLDVTRASLYYHIENKEQLLRDICNKVMRDALEDSRGILESDLSPKEKLQEYIRSKVVTSADRRDLCIVIFEQANALNTRTRKKLQRQMSEFDQILIDILQEGVDEGVFQIDDIRMASFVILGACFWTYHWYHPEGRLTPNEIADEVINLLERGYLKAPSVTRETREEVDNVKPAKTRIGFTYP